MLLRALLILSLIAQPLFGGRFERSCAGHAVEEALASSESCGSTCCGVEEVRPEPACPMCDLDEPAACTNCGRCLLTQSTPVQHRTAPSGEREQQQKDDPGEPVRPAWASVVELSPAPKRPAFLDGKPPPRSGRERLVSKSVLTV